MSDGWGVFAEVGTAIGGAIASVFAAIGTASWRARGMIDDAKAEAKTATAELERRNIEAMSALNEKLHEHRDWVHGTFVRRDDFAAVTSAINRTVDSVANKMDAGFTAVRADMAAGMHALGEKIERLQQRN